MKSRGVPPSLPLDLVPPAGPSAAGPSAAGPSRPVELSRPAGLSRPSEPSPAGPPVLTVSRLLSAVRLTVEREVGLVWVGGEISGCSRATSGHWYFCLKDATAQVRCILFRTKAQGLPFTLRDGLAVEVRAVPTFYEARGEFQLNVETVRLAGLGALYERFARLKARLEAEGWFAPGRKRALPRYPRAVGIVTSRRAAALRDVLTTLARRWPALRVIVYPAAVQGQGAADELAAAIVAANARAEVDLLIVCRGGGSLEDLWAFNELALARAVYQSALPIVSGVGHETDFTICDFVADVRAPTPTGAATQVAPDRDALAHRLGQLARRLARCAQHDFATRAQRIDALSRRVVHPAARIARQSEAAQRLAARMHTALERDLERRAGRTQACQTRLLRELRLPLPGVRALMQTRAALPRAGRTRIEGLAARIGTLAQNLAHLNPAAVLDRGYAIVARSDGVIVQDAAQLRMGDRVHMTFARGDAKGTVTATSEPAPAAGTTPG